MEEDQVLQAVARDQESPPFSGQSVQGQGLGTLSRTKKGQKGPGHEYWSRRPGNKAGGAPGKFTKKRTAKAERKIDKKLEQEEG